ncbi:hypothetical protein [Clostridium sp. AWRP]|uniref:hypothetical protein n=1 Tax=Clostridium sp. AWRP TaxID=2212991 RepID=UPI000FDA4318|nr:hypothetical protein [Clostridium sp. AWRP]AZV56069.1 hypothetical protein DMR38_05355 [Clostridium sp. AWRP]
MLSCQEIIQKRKELWEANKDSELDREYTWAVADKLCSPSCEGIRQEIKDHPERLIEMCFSVVNKELQTVPFFLNDVQQKLSEKLNEAIEDYKQGKRHHLKFLVLKGRQQGFTTFITAYQLSKTITNRNFTGMTVADSADNTATIFEDKAKFPYSLLPPLLQPQEKYNTRQELHFSQLNSKWRIATAGNKQIGRSKTINFFHASEAAFFDSIQSIMGGLGQALTKDSIQILESTANGFNEYRTLWSEGEQKENNWEPLFFEWWKTSEYRLTFETKEAEETFKNRVLNPSTKFEHKLKWLLQDKKLDWKQLYWYSAKQKDLKELLDQEYPCTPLEAFLSSGIPVFDVEKVLKRRDYLIQECKVNPPKRYSISYKYVNQMIVDSSIKINENVNGELIIYEHPKQGYPYVLGADTAEGGEDYCVGQVLDNTTGKQVAKWRGRADTDIFAKQLYCLGKYYNNALIGVEMNFDLHPVKELERLNYPNQYMRETMDQLSGKLEKRYGFNTNKATRPVIIGDLVEVVREETHLINDVETLSELIVFQKIDGKAQAAEGEHDDCVMSLAIAHKIRDQMITKIKLPKKEQTLMEKDFERRVKSLKRIRKGTL